MLDAGTQFIYPEVGTKLNLTLQPEEKKFVIIRQAAGATGYNDKVDCKYDGTFEDGETFELRKIGEESAGEEEGME